MRRRDLHSAPLAERVAVEQRLWDKVRDETCADRSLLQLTHPTYEDFFTAYPEYRYVHEFFGPSVAGRRILEVGCGAGVVSVALANSGAHVTAVDVSASALRVTRERAAHFVVDPIDAVLLRLAPPLRRLAQTVVVRLGRREPGIQAGQ
jgi:2-polyprenyl-3-methyl-5-hydroxy-6-metoxy-1,4-benzoquinol methylase